MTRLTINENPMPPVSEAVMLCEYDGSGRRTRREITDLRGAMPTTEDVRFVYDQWGHLIAEYYPYGDWNLKREYVNDANGVVCTLDYEGEEYKRGFHLKDHLGSTRVVCKDQAAALRPEYDYRMQIVWTGD